MNELRFYFVRVHFNPILIFECDTFYVTVNLKLKDF